MWNGTIFVDLDWPLNASSLLSASAELLVKIVLDNIFRQLKRRINNERGEIPDQVFAVEFADDTALVAECMDRILERTGLSAEENQKRGIKISTKKSKIMPVTKNNGPYQQVFSRGNVIEIVHNGIYFGSDIDTQCILYKRHQTTDGFGRTCNE